MKCWFAVHTHPQSEEKAVYHLRRQGFRVYAPKYRSKRRHARREQLVARALFPRYVFVALDLEAERWRAVNSTVGVIGLICAGERPLRVPDGVIQGILEREQDGFVRLVPAAMKVGEPVRITGGAFADQVGVLQCVDDNARVTLLLSLLGRAVKVSVNAEDIARAA